MHHGNKHFARESLALIFVAIVFGASAVCAQTASFTYQGRLTDSGNPPSGNYDLQFSLFDNSSGGTQIGSTLTRSSVAVGGAVFSLMNQMRV